jgi:hypothetical protein
MLVEMCFRPCFESSITKPPFRTPALTEGTLTQIPEMSNRRIGTLNSTKEKRAYILCDCRDCPLVQTISSAKN